MQKPTLIFGAEWWYVARICNLIVVPFFNHSSIILSPWELNYVHLLITMIMSAGLGLKYRILLWHVELSLACLPRS